MQMLVVRVDGHDSRLWPRPANDCLQLRERNRRDVVGEGARADRRVDGITAQPADELPPAGKGDVLDQEVPEGEIATHSPKICRKLSSFRRSSSKPSIVSPFDD